MSADGKQNRNEGAITVFLAVNFLCIFALLGTLIDGARIVDARTQLFHAADMSATSALASFQHNLKDQYGLMAYIGDPTELLKQVAEKNLTLSGGHESGNQWLYDLFGAEAFDLENSFDLLKLQNISATASPTPLTLLNPNEFERQIFEYVKYRGVLELADLEIDLEELSQINTEMEKAKNERTVDKEMMDLQEELADFLNHVSKYNQKLEKLKAKLDSAEERYNETVEDAADGRYGSMASQLEHLQDEFDVAGTCGELSRELDELEEESKQLMESADAMKARFSSSAAPATFDGLEISSDMHKSFLDDIANVKAWGALTFVGGSTVSAQKSALESTKDSAEDIVKDLDVLIQEVDDAADGSSDRREEAVEYVYASLDEDEYRRRENDEDFSALRTWQDMNRFVSAKDSLREIKKGETSDKEDDSQTILDEYNKASEETKRNYTRVIPAGYALPSALAAEEAKTQAKVKKTNVSSNFEDVKNSRRENSGDISAMLEPAANWGLNTLDNAMLATYALGNFENAMCFRSGDKQAEENTAKYLDNMRNDRKTGFFEDCAVEYLIKGNLEEKKNYEGIYGELFLIYMPMNYACVRRVEEIKGVVEVIARAAETAAIAASAGNVGIGKIVYYATREAVYASIAGLQAAYDIEELLKGNKSAILKNERKHFTGALQVLPGALGLGVGEAPKDDAQKGKLLLSYSGYLTLRMIFMDHDTLVGRLQNLVEINMNGSGGTLSTEKKFELGKANTTVTATVSATMPFWFINLMIATDAFDGTGMKLQKQVSQKY